MSDGHMFFLRSVTSYLFTHVKHPSCALQWLKKRIEHVTEIVNTKQLSTEGQVSKHTKTEHVTEIVTTEYKGH